MVSGLFSILVNMKVLDPASGKRNIIIGDPPYNLKPAITRRVGVAIAWLLKQSLPDRRSQFNLEI
jgi:hypothetical protein